MRTSQASSGLRPKNAPVFTDCARLGRGDGDQFGGPNRPARIGNLVRGAIRALNGVDGQTCDVESRESRIPMTRYCDPLRRRLTSLLHARQTDEGMRSAGRKNLGCLSGLLDRPQKCQQVGVDFILVCGCQAVRPARIVNFLRPFDQPGRFLR